MGGPPGLGAAGPGLNVRKFLTPRSDTLLCLRVMDNLWNGLFSKELLFS